MNISGGTQRQALELANHLQNMGYKISVYTAYYNKERCYPVLLENLNVKYLFHDNRREIEEKKNKKLLEKSMLFLKNILSIWLSVFKEEKLYNRLTDLIDRDLDLLNCHDYGVYPVSAKYKRKTAIPVVWQMNDLPVYKLSFNNLKAILEFIISPIKLIRWWHGRYIRKMDSIMVLDNLNKNKLKDNLGIESTIVRSGLDIKKFSYVEKKVNKENLRLLSNSIFYPYRRLEDLIEASRILREKNVKFELTHVGTDENCKWYAEKIYRMIKKSNLSDLIRFYGFVSEEKLIELYSAADIFVFPSHHQTWGLTVFEAMACGTPVIVTTSCGASEVLTNEETALMVPSKSPGKIAEAIIRLKEDSKLREKLSMNGRMFVEKNIRWDIYTKSVVEVFKKVLDAKKITQGGEPMKKALITGV